MTSNDQFNLPLLDSTWTRQVTTVFCLRGPWPSHDAQRGCRVSRHGTAWADAPSARGTVSRNGATGRVSQVSKAWLLSTVF